MEKLDREKFNQDAIGKEKEIGLAQELREYPKIKPRLTFLFPLNKNRKNALEMIQSDIANEQEIITLLKSDDFIERRAGSYLLDKIHFSKDNYNIFYPILDRLIQDDNPLIVGKAVQKKLQLVAEFQDKEIISNFQQFCQDKRWYVRKALVQPLISNLDVHTFSFIEQLSQDEDSEVKETVAHFLSARINVDTLPIIERLSQDKWAGARKAVAQFLAEINIKTFPIIERLSQDTDSEIRKTVARSLLADINADTLPIIEQLSRDKDMDVRKTVAQGLINIKEMELFVKVKPILESLKQDKNFNIRKMAVQAEIQIIINQQKEKALPILEKMSIDENQIVREVVVQFLGNFGEQALSMIERMSQDKDIDVKKAAICSLGKTGEKALPILEQLSQDKRWDIKEIIIEALSNFGKKSLPVLERMSQDKDAVVKKKIAQVLSGFGMEASSLLEAMREDKDSEVQVAADMSLRKIKMDYKKKDKRLLATKKPLFATFYTKELVERIKEIEDITQLLKNKFKDQFIGVVILGSTVKGYFQKGSDLDWAVIAKDKIVSDSFLKLAHHLDPCYENYIQVDKQNKIQEGIDVLFYGLFLGDREELLKLQKRNLENMNEKQWDDTRKQIMSNEINILKAQKRFDFSEKELEKAMQAIAVLRVPPSYKETLNIIQKQIQRKYK